MQFSPTLFFLLTTTVVFALSVATRRPFITMTVNVNLKCPLKEGFNGNVTLVVSDKYLNESSVATYSFSSALGAGEILVKLIGHPNYLYWYKKNITSRLEIFSDCTGKMKILKILNQDCLARECTLDLISVDLATGEKS